MNIDKWDLFAICESILFVSEKPVTVEQVVTVLEREHDEALERAQDEEDERSRLNRIASAEVKDAAFDTSLRSETATEQMEAAPVAESTTLEGFEELPVAEAAPMVDSEGEPEPVVPETPEDDDVAAYLAAKKRDFGSVTTAEMLVAGAEQTDIATSTDEGDVVAVAKGKGSKKKGRKDAEVAAATEAETTADASQTLSQTQTQTPDVVADADGTAESSNESALASADAAVATEAAAGEEVAAAGEEVAAAGEEVAAAGEEVAAAGEEVAAAGEEVAAAGEESTSAEATTAAEAVQSEPLAADEVAEQAAQVREQNSPDAVRRRKLKKELTKLVEDAFGALMNVYSDPTRTTGRGLQLVNVAGAFQFRTNPDCAPFIRHHLQVKPTKLSRAQVETLAIIAYRQPVTRPEIEHIRGVDCGAGIKILLDRKLVRILGKKEEVGRPLLYGTTKEFLEFFNLGSLLELPTLREFQELSDEHKKKVEEEIEADAPLGDLRSLAEGQPTFQVDDSALMADVDSALQGAKQTVARVAELTGMKAQDEDAKAD